jgi:hypothetical protein
MLIDDDSVSFGEAPSTAFGGSINSHRRADLHYGVSSAWEEASLVIRVNQA